jgi:hypothetical protein
MKPIPGVRSYLLLAKRALVDFSDLASIKFFCVRPGRYAEERKFSGGTKKESILPGR